ncbi:hypothetical protein [Micromonospora sp. LOL_021]|uniref:hypothetical protein n=1 Tax=Micromonospora sp. LOL_021 TaxID=3345417 RepID=UPI003A8C48B1
MSHLQLVASVPVSPAVPVASVILEAGEEGICASAPYTSLSDVPVSSSQNCRGHAMA